MDDLLNLSDVSNTSGIKSFSGPYESRSENFLYLNTNDGQQLYLSLDRGIITTEKPEAS